MARTITGGVVVHRDGDVRVGKVEVRTADVCGPDASPAVGR
ncbi:hypothetical protein [Actinomycetospora lemnae]|uniref:Uncharacterized protein n=1 Tax=Actinomycetospora lemnae TaxID=3019891 RepID=A0ABT5SVC7_9PSEU|nr:hypothetical protein [Actinomycetospora sp. DW7H6]MDD7966809.1 hypothetical protein [Actinomycetospora sp. DW7H6]